MPASDSGPPPWRTEIHEIERQVERGSLFTHTALSETAERVSEVESFLYGLVDLLTTAQAIDQAALGAAAAAVREQLDQRGDAVSPGITLRVEDDQLENDVMPVNCAERMPVCQAVCCRLNFALSASEIEVGAVKWDLGRPYQIRHDAAGTCVHRDGETQGCTVYAERPGVCRRYSCAHDERIWADFENMRLNTSWIEQNLRGTAPRLARASMIQLPDPVLRSGAQGEPQHAPDR